MVPGLGYLAAYLDVSEQDGLLATIDRQRWLTDLSRRVQHYGYRYDYTRKKVDATMHLGPLPEWAERLAGRLQEDGHSPDRLDQLIVNEYFPGQGVALHVDCVPCFGDTVLSLSLGSTCVMTMSHPPTQTRIDILLEPGSLLVLQGPARYEWRHGIGGRKTDHHNGQTYRRTRRVSLTFRRVLRARGPQANRTQP
jgi:alkylated DNA repair dioxygenase AlkB